MSQTTVGDASSILRGDARVADVMQLSDGQLEVLYGMAYTYYQQARYADAHPLLQLVAMCDHTSERYWLALAGCRQMLGDFLLAAESYVVAAGCNLANPVAAIQAAFCLLRAGDAGASEPWIVEAERRVGEDETLQKKCAQLRVALERATQPTESTAQG